MQRIRDSGVLKESCCNSLPQLTQRSPGNLRPGSVPGGRPQMNIEAVRLRILEDGKALKDRRCEVLGVRW